MNLKNLSVKKALDDDERADLRDALRKDEIIIPAILKVLAQHLSECRPTKDMLGDLAYPFRRAAKDGAQMELEFLIDILTQDKE